ncbi:MAG: bifunctional DNA-formamidopyrimidine glycosylase/DNA-(apurinic or apyrimidinic site) lyase [Acidobacteriia bacterium]|nr:bifunctional DNA-formamidopyrimidine glycosylase/DNA-(apurinic or apyrimidinic site) lyase [Terriglobia bacterium]
MPELPEAETIVRGLKHRVVNRTLAAFDFPPAKHFRPEVIQPLDLYQGALIQDVFRHGKSVILKVQSPDASFNFILIRLGMTGKLLLDSAPDRHTHAIFHLTNPDGTLSFQDIRQFGRMYFLKDWRVIFSSKRSTARPVDFVDGESLPRTTQSPQAEALIGDALTMTPQQFIELFWKRRGMIKAALMSQKLLVGVGNIYADESLFAARIHPRQTIQRLSRRRLEDYFHALQKILHTAIELGGSSISDFVDADNYPGEFQMEHRVYGREGRRCRRRGCPGVIRRILVASRGTHYCPRCQRMI